MTNKEALEHLWESVDKSSIYQLSYIRNLAFELGEKELYFIFKEVSVEGYQPSITVKATEWFLNGKPINTVEARHQHVSSKLIPNRD
jgi:hypothetical protein